MATLRELRRARGITQAELGARLRVTQTAVAKWESGARVPHYETARDLAEILGVPLDELEFPALREKGPAPIRSWTKAEWTAQRKSWKAYGSLLRAFARSALTPPYAVRPKELAHIVGLDDSTIRREIHRGHLPAKTLGRRLLIPTFAALEWIERRGAHFGLTPEMVEAAPEARQYLEEWKADIEAREEGRNCGPQAGAQ